MFGATLSDSVPLPPRPTSAWVIAGAVGVVEAALPEEMSAGAALEIWPESFDAAAESVVAVESAAAVASAPVEFDEVEKNV